MQKRNGRDSKALKSKAVESKDDSDSSDFEPEKDYNSPKSSVRKKIKPRQSKNNKENQQNNANIIHKAKEKNVIPNKNEKHFWQVEGVTGDTFKSKSVTSKNLIHFLRNQSWNSYSPPWQAQAVNYPIVEKVKLLKVYNVIQEVFDRRITAVTWHPTNPHIAAIGSKGGDIIIWNYEDDERIHSIRGIGPGGSVQQMVFDKANPSYLYSVSIDGTLVRHHYQSGVRRPYLSTGDLNHWYTSLDVSLKGKVILVGDNKGNVTFVTPDGEQVWTERLHKSKVTHIEFSPRENWCLVTASVDRSLKVWDIRNMKSQTSCLYTLMHEKPINSAYFSRAYGTRLLTTDQNSEIRVYDCPSFTPTQIISHPHRHFQHLTPIKATWHPLHDIIVVGRYPDPCFPGYVEGEPRSIDFFDGATGELLYQHVPRGMGKKIVSLNTFNIAGDTLLSGAAMDAWVWKPDYRRLAREYKSGSPNSMGPSDSWGDDDDDDDDNDHFNDLDAKKKEKKKKTKTRRKKSLAVDEVKKKIKSLNEDD